MSHAFDILGDPVRRRILELLADGQRASGEIVEVIAAEFAISQPAVSQHLRILRDSGFATSRADGRRRLYAVAPERFDEVDAWVQRFRRTWEPRFEALATEVARGKKARRAGSSPLPLAGGVGGEPVRKAPAVDMPAPSPSRKREGH